MIFQPKEHGPSYGSGFLKEDITDEEVIEKEPSEEMAREIHQKSLVRQCKLMEMKKISQFVLLIFGLLSSIGFIIGLVLQRSSLIDLGLVTFLIIVATPLILSGYNERISQEKTIQKKIENSINFKF